MTCTYFEEKVFIFQGGNKKLKSPYLYHNFLHVTNVGY